MLIIHFDESLRLVIFRIIKTRLEPILADVTLDRGQAAVFYPYRIFIVLHRIDEQLIMIAAQSNDIVALLYESSHLLNNFLTLGTTIAIIAEKNQLIF
ncbi:hypothetical protein D1872_261310 [compost metagenome]